MNKTALLPLACFFLSITAILGFIFPENRRTESARTVLLNPKNLQNTAIIEITQDSFFLVLRKSGVIWKGVADGAEFFTDGTLPTDLLLELSSPRSVYTVREKPPSYEPYGLDDNNALHMKIRGENGELYADLFFGKENFSGLDIFFRNAKTPRVYQTASSRLSRFLSAQAEKWADMQLFPQATGRSSSENILSIHIRDSEGDRVLHNTASNAAAFDEYARFLFEARGSAVFPTDISLPAVASIKITDSLGQENLLSVYRDGVSFFAVNETAGGTCALEISTWTLERLLFKRS